jgi:hypothetical protein
LAAGECSFDLAEHLTPLCKGQTSCSVHCDDTVAKCTIIGGTGSATVLNLTTLSGPPPAGGPGWKCGANAAANRLTAKLLCPAISKAGHVLTVEVVVPPSSDAVTKLPLLGSDGTSLIVSEGGRTIWKEGKFVRGVPGLKGAEVDGDGEVLAVSHGSGRYKFVMLAAL